jgi:hydroxyacylglutathione hydrolase
MIVKRFYDEKLAQASYLLGCPATGQALVVDPVRDVDEYVRVAEAEGVGITHVAETHIHADFVSGARELAERTGARLHLSDEGGPDWRYAYAAEYDAEMLKDGDVFRVGNIRIDVLHTPGHTPEHLTFLVTDGAAADRPIAALTGDFVFVGDVGRPDLLERAAGMEGTMEAGARTLFHSLQRFKEQPDWLQIWPGHGAGSACGKGLSAIPHSTVGYERMFNWGLTVEDEDEFVATVLAGQPEPPRYFAEMKRLNREGPPVLGGLRRPQRLPETRLAGVLETGATVVDTRHAADFAAGHVPGTINVPLNRGFTPWVGWLVPYDRDLYLIVDDARGEAVDEAARDLTIIGLDRLAGYFGAEAVGAWAAEGRALQRISRIAPAEAAERRERGEVAVLDVRGAAEWEAGHVPGAPNVPVGHLVERLAEIPRDRPVVVHCQAGMRSAIAASVLQAHGVSEVLDMIGGFGAWRAAGLPVEGGAGDAAAGM